MSFDFPSSPSVGLKFPATPQPGIPTYTWDGEKWTTIGGSISGGMAVVYSAAQTLTAGQQYQARQNINAPSLDSSLAYGGIQVNGAMEVNQLGLAAPDAQTYVCDNWAWVKSSASVFTAQAISNPGLLPGMANYLHAACTTTTSPAAADYVFFRQYIEGYRTTRLAWGYANAKPLTLCFWSAHQLTGLHAVAVQNGANNRSYIATYTHAAAGTPQYNVVTIPGDTIGTWAKDHTTGLSILFNLACGSNYNTPGANAWAAGNYITASGVVNAASSTSSIVRIGGVLAIPGSEGPSATSSPYVLRTYPEELMVCRRYWQPLLVALEANQPTGQYMTQPVYFVPPMRIAPAMTLGTVFFSANCAAPILVGGSTITNYGCSLQSAISAAGRAYYHGPASFDARL